MSIIRDYGTLGGAGYTGASTDTGHYGQVYQATHQNNERLSYMKRSFISFTFSDPNYEHPEQTKLVHIEDFNLIVVFSNNRFERDGYTSFNDLTTTYDNLDGQYYWGSHYKAQTITFQLATDGIDEKMLEEFLHWFSPGVSRELILSEHPNRARMARVAEPPRLSLLPFESHTTMKISNYEYPVTTTMYKGEITLTLTMDEPHWYAKDNILGKKVEETIEGSNETRTRYIDWWRDTTKNPAEDVYIFSSADALKILYEDGIPLGSMIDNNMLLGNGAYANVEKNVEAEIWSIANDADIAWEDGEPAGHGARINGIITAADIEENGYNEETNPNGIRSKAGTYYGIIAGAIVNANGQGIVELNSHSNGSTGYFFYSGTAPSPAILQFNFKPMTDESTSYVTTPSNKFVNAAEPYSIITIGSQTIQELYFTTPNVLTSYNTAIKLFIDDCRTNQSYENMRKHIRENVRHQYVRQWAIKVIDYAEENAVTDVSEFCTYMSYFLKDAEAKVYSVKCEFNSETGDCFGWFHYRKITDDIPESSSDWQTYGNNIPDKNDTSSLIKEDIGDMIRSNYLMIKERNYPTENGRIVKWENDHPEYSHYIYHNFNSPLNNLSIIYKNMYL